MEVSSSWIATVMVAVVCLAYSWLLGIAARRHEIHLGMIGPTVGVVGTLILAAMAVVGPSSKFEKKRVVMPVLISEGYSRASAGETRRMQLLSIVSRATDKLGTRPSDDHVAYEHPNGRLEWVTKEKYAKLIKGGD